MKRYIIALLVLLSSNVYAQSWVIQNSGTTQNINDIYFVNSTTGFASGNGGVLLKTINGGNNWLTITGPFTIDLIGVRFFDQNTGLVFGDNIYRTTNGGLNWSQVWVNNHEQLWRCAIADSNTLYECELFRLAKTTNRGDNWTETSYTPPFTTSSTFFNNALTGWVTTWQPQGFPTPTHEWAFIAKTTDGGGSWTTVYSEYGVIETNTMFDITFPTLDTGFVIGKSGGSVYKTLNGGNNWQETVMGRQLNDLNFIDSRTGWACGIAGYVFKTTNAGNIWINSPTLTSNSLNSIFFINSLTGWAGGNNGTIIKTTDGGLTFIYEISNIIPDAFSLGQNYPNPFNPSTKIKFDLPRSGNAKLVIYDILGREVTTLVNEQLKPGSYEVEWDGSNYASGVYFYQLVTEKFTETKRMVLIK